MPFDYNAGPWVKNYPSGVRFYLTDPQPDAIRLEDIAHQLANQCRFTGAVQHFYSVAEHSLLVAHFAPAHLKLKAKLHDAHEYVTGDFIRPLKHGISPEFSEAYEAICRPIQHVIYRKFGCTTEDEREIKIADGIALGLEARHLKDVSYGEGWDYYLRLADSVGACPWRLGRRGSMQEVAEDFELAVRDDLNRRDLKFAA